MAKRKRISGKVICGNIAHSVLAQMAALDDKELKAVVKASGQLTETNCGWYVYRMREVLCNFAKDTIRGRKAMMAKKKKEGTP